jgi:hypothetical protein
MRAVSCGGSLPKAWGRAGSGEGGAVGGLAVESGVQRAVGVHAPRGERAPGPALQLRVQGGKKERKTYAREERARSKSHRTCREETARAVLLTCMTRHSWSAVLVPGKSARPEAISASVQPMDQTCVRRHGTRISVACKGLRAVCCTFADVHTGWGRPERGPCLGSYSLNSSWAVA